MSTKAKKQAQRKSREHPFTMPPHDWLQPKRYKPYKVKLQKPRLPTTEEQQEVLDYIIRNGDNSEDQNGNIASMLFDDSRVAVFDNYQTHPSGRYGWYEG